MFYNILTKIVDYCLFMSLMMYWYDKELTPLNGSLFFQYVVFVICVKEYIWSKILPNLPKVKRQWYKPEYVAYGAIFKVLIVFFVSFNVAIKYGLIQRKEYPSVKDYILNIYKEHLLLLVIADLINERIMHRLMHHVKFMRRFHKLHHRAVRNTSAIQGLQLDVVEIMLANICEFPVLGLIYYLLDMSPSLDYVSSILFLATQLHNHSINIHSLWFFSPLDFFIKPTITHQLHHIKPDGFAHIPYYHLWRGYHEEEERYHQAFLRD